MSFVLMFGGFSGDKAPLESNQMPVAVDTVAPMVPYVADYSGHFSVQVGESWQHRFQANKALKDNGAVFFIKLTEVTGGGQYKVIARRGMVLSPMSILAMLLLRLKVSMAMRML